MDTIRERCLKNLVTTLQTIKTANGYDNTVEDLAVQRFKQNGQPLSVGNNLLIIYEGEDETDEQPLTLTTHRLAVAIQVLARYDEAADPRSGAEVCNSLMGDVLKAVLGDVTRGGVAIETLHTGASPLAEDAQKLLLEFFMGFEITYRHRFADPKVAT